MKIVSTLALVVAAGTAMAGESYDVSGSSVGQAENSYTPLGESHIYITSTTAYTLPANGTPLDGSKGECSGYIQVALGSGAVGSGFCVWSDADGDTWFGPWNVTGASAEGASQGNWYVSGGTGKYASAAGGGTFVTLTNPATGESKLDVAGSVTLK